MLLEIVAHVLREALHAEGAISQRGGAVALKLDGMHVECIVQQRRQGRELIASAERAVEQQ
jgi:hypothetical protein